MLTRRQAPIRSCRVVCLSSAAQSAVTASATKASRYLNERPSWQRDLLLKDDGSGSLREHVRMLPLTRPVVHLQAAVLRATHQRASRTRGDRIRTPLAPWPK